MALLFRCVTVNYLCFWNTSSPDSGKEKDKEKESAKSANIFQLVSQWQ